MGACGPHTATAADTQHGAQLAPPRRPKKNMKTGTISLLNENNLVDPEILSGLRGKVVPVTPPSGTLGSMVNACMAGLALAAVIIVDFGRLQVSAFKSEATGLILMAVDSGLGATDILHFVPSDTTKRSSSISISDNTLGTITGTVAAATVQTPFALLLASAFGPAPSGRSVSGIVDAVDGILNDATVQLDGFMVFDQPAATVTLYIRDTSAISSISDGSVSAENHIATFLLTATTTSSTGVGFFQL